MNVLRKIQLPLIFVTIFTLLCGCAKSTAEIPLTTPEPEAMASQTAVVPEVSPTLSSAEMYEPLAESVCQTLQQAATDALKVQFTLEQPAPFEDEVAGEGGQGCRLTAQGDGTVFPDVVTVMNELTQSLALGWNEEKDHAAGGPTGEMMGFSRDMALMLVKVEWMPAEGTSCPQDQPISACELTPEQKSYTVEIDVAQYRADFSMDGHWVDDATGFTLDLYQDWKNIWGQHTVVAQNGNKIDSLEASIEGKLNGKVATVTYKSSFTSETGTAEITYIDVNTIHWKVISAPNGENYFPAEATLTRKAQE